MIELLEFFNQAHGVAAKAGVVEAPEATIDTDVFFVFRFSFHIILDKRYFSSKEMPVRVSQVRILGYLFW